MDLVDLLIIFLGWKSKLIAARPRTAKIKNVVKKHPLWRTHHAAIMDLLNKVENGDDLTPYLSLKALKEGYSADQARATYWDDKDLILNVTGFHHIHLDPGRTNETLFAHVTRDTITVHGMFNHDVFKEPNPDGTLNTERIRMLKLHEDIVSQGQSGTFALSMLAGDGNPTRVVRMAQKYNKTIEENDPKITERSFINQLYAHAKITSPTKFKLKWQIKDSDLCLFDSKNDLAFTMLHGFT